MIYTFAIVPKARSNRLSTLNRNRTISVCANSEPEARQALDGLPLVFLKSLPEGEK